MKESTSFKDDSIGGITSKWIDLGLSVLLIVLLVVLVSVMFFDSVAEEAENLLGTTHKAETLRIIGWVIIGMLAGVWLVLLSRRAKLRVEYNRLVEKRERFEIAMKHLKYDNVSARTVAFYEFIQLANDNQGEYRTRILDILYTHIRSATGDFANPENVKDAKEKNEPKKLTEEIQELLNVLFKYRDVVRSDIKPNFQKVCFSGADLRGGKLSSVDFSNADLSDVNFDAADLFGANLSEAQLNRASLRKSELANVRFLDATLSEADLSGADLSGADLSRADLSGADLSGADLTGANFRLANLSNAQLGGAKYTNNTRFPKSLILPIAPPNNGNKVQFPEKFFAPSKKQI